MHDDKILRLLIENGGLATFLYTKGGCRGRRILPCDELGSALHVGRAASARYTG
jgi:hypothetical protein